MARRVRLEGDPEEYEVVCEGDTFLLLRNPAARQRRTIAELEAQLDTARRQLEEEHRRALQDSAS